jgi:hypothetical protein
MKYTHIVKYSAIYDLLVTFPFALPKVCEVQIEILKRLHVGLHMAGSIPDFHPIHYFFVNLMGSLVVVWSVLRIRHPQELFGLYDGYARLLFSACMIYYLFVFQVTGLLWFLFFPEMIWGAVQLIGYARLKRQYDPLVLAPDQCS